MHNSVSVEMPNILKDKNKPIVGCTAEAFGMDVFDLKKMRIHLPKPIFKAFKHQTNDGQPITKDVADAVAHAVRVWAMEKGATHFTHWFQPLTGLTAEKHDSFLSFGYTSVDGRIEV